MALIVVKDVHFAYDDSKFVLRGVNLEVKLGEVVTLLGPNGSGKTTLLRCIYKVLKPRIGCIYIDGKNILDLTSREIAKVISGVPQEHETTFPYRVIDVVVMGKTPFLDLFSAPSIKDYKVAKNILEKLGKAELAERPYTQISGGERQLVLIARALMQNPRVMLLDEPTKHLDIVNKMKVLSIIKKLAVEKRLAVLMTLHDPNEAIMFSDKIVLVKEGKVICSISSEELTAESLEKVYGMPFRLVKDGNVKTILPVLEYTV